MGYKINFGSGAVSLPASVIDTCHNLLQLRLLMLLSYERQFSEAEDPEIAERLGCTEKELSEAVSELRAIKLLAPEKKLAPSASSKNLGSGEIAREIDNSGELKHLIEECQYICGKIFTPTDISKLVSLKKDLGYDGETITLLFFYFSEKLDADGKKASVGYIEKSAYGLYNQGIKTLPDLQKYIKDTETKNSLAYKFRRLFGMGERAITSKEKKFFDKWSIEWETPFELIEYAYEITVDKTGKAGLEYMSKILSDWHTAGITTVSAAEKSSKEFKSSDKYKKKFTEKTDETEESKSSFNTDEFFEKALKRSYAMMNEGKGGES